MCKLSKVQSQDQKAKGLRLILKSQLQSGLLYVLTTGIVLLKTELL